MSKTIKQRKKFYSISKHKWFYKTIETTEIKALCEKKAYGKRGQLHAVNEAITDLDEWYGLDEVSDKRVIEEIEYKVDVWIGNYNECRDTRYEVNHRDMTEQEMSREVARTRKFIQKLKELL